MDTDQADHQDAAELYRKLEHVIAPLFCDHRDAWVDVMRHCIVLNGSFFTTDRMVRQYVQHAYGLALPTALEKNARR